MKKIEFFMLCFFVGCFSVSAKEIRFYFYPNGGVVNTENFEVSSYGYLHYNDSYYARYDTDDSIPNINSISNVTFSVVKNGDSLVSGREWYTQVNDQKYFLSESKAYSVEALFEQIGSTNDSVYSLDLYANWSSLKIDGVDISTRMHHHRGTVQKNTCQTITTSGGENVGVVIKENEQWFRNKNPSRRL